MLSTGNMFENEGFGMRAVQVYMSTTGVLVVSASPRISAFFNPHTPHNAHI